MNWDDLKVFLAVAKASSLAEAGRTLGMSAATVARKAVALEAALGVPLFLKTVNGYALTEPGRTLLPLAQEAEQRFRWIERCMAQPGGRVAGRVRIDCPEIMGAHLIIPGLGELQARYPALQFDFVNSAVSSALTLSHSDIVIRLHRPEAGAFTVRRVAELGQSLFCAHAYAQAHGLPGEPSDLQKHRLIGWTEDLSHMPLARWLHGISGGQPPWMRASNLNAQLRAVEAGLGIAALPDYAGRALGLRQVLPQLPGHRSEVWLLRHQATSGVARVDAVVAHLARLLPEAVRA